MLLLTLPPERTPPYALIAEQAKAGFCFRATRKDQANGESGIIRSSVLGEVSGSGAFPYRSVNCSVAPFGERVYTLPSIPIRRLR